MSLRYIFSNWTIFLKQRHLMCISSMDDLIILQRCWMGPVTRHIVDVDCKHVGWPNHLSLTFPTLNSAKFMEFRWQWDHLAHLWMWRRCLSSISVYGSLLSLSHVPVVSLCVNCCHGWPKLTDQYYSIQAPVSGCCMAISAPILHFCQIYVLSVTMSSHISRILEFESITSVLYTRNQLWWMIVLLPNVNKSDINSVALVLLWRINAILMEANFCSCPSPIGGCSSLRPEEARSSCWIVRKPTFISMYLSRMPNLHFRHNSELFLPHLWIPIDKHISMASTCTQAPPYSIMKYVQVKAKGCISSSSLIKATQYSAMTRWRGQCQIPRPTPTRRWTTTIPWRTHRPTTCSSSLLAWRRCSSSSSFPSPCFATPTTWTKFRRGTHWSMGRSSPPAAAARRALSITRVQMQVRTRSTPELPFMRFKSPGKRNPHSLPIPHHCHPTGIAMTRALPVLWHPSQTGSRRGRLRLNILEGSWSGSRRRWSRLEPCLCSPPNLLSMWSPFLLRCSTS